MNTDSIFHLAIPINDIEQAKKFYCDGLGCLPGRENNQALILNFYGHQLVAHKTEEILKPQKGIYPRHFGLVFSQKSDWEQILTRSQEKKLTFYQQPKLRFAKKFLEHYTFFLQDPFYNLLEFKFYLNNQAIFGGHEYKDIGER